MAPSFGQRLEGSRLRRAAAAWGAVALAYMAYAVLFVPWIEPAVAPHARSREAMPRARGETHHAQRQRILASLFPPDAWELNDARVKVLETEYGMLLLSDYRTRAGGQLEIHPCTLVLEVPSRQPDQAGRYLALRAPQGAVLQFDRPIDLRRAQIGQPTGGRLQGEVRIFSPGSRPDGSDRLEIVTQNVQMDARRVWTPHEVNFRLGRSFGAGRGLTIELLPDRSSKPRSAGAVSVAGVRTLELSHVEKAHFEAPPDGLFAEAPPLAPGAGERSAQDRALETPLEIACQGPFRFDFERFVASFEDDVDVRRLHADGPSDQVSCQLLEIHFTPPRSAPFGRPHLSDAAPAPEKPVGEDERSVGIVRRLVAVGRPVFVRAPSVGAFVQGDRLEYDVLTRRLRVQQNRPPALPEGAGPATPRPNAVLQHQGRYCESPQLQYQMGPPHRLGSLWAAGPGVFRGPLPKGSQRVSELPADAELEIVWQGEIYLRPHEGLHVASVTGGASARLGDLGGFDAGELHLWLREVPQAGDAASDPTAANEPRWRVLPDRLLAQNGVKLRSPRFSGATQKLEAWFEDAPPADERAGSRTLLGSRDSGAARQPSQQAFDVRGDLVQLRLLRRGEATVLEDATIRGHAVIQETRTEKPGETPLLVAGDVVELREGSGPRTRLLVVGDPQRDLRAQAGARGVTFVGWQLQVDQGANRVWIDGPGRLTLPVRQHALTRFGGAGSPTPTTASLAVAWRKGLDFNGQRVLIEENVETRGDGQTIRSDSLQAFLARPLNLAEPAEFEQVEIARLLFGGRPQDVQGVRFENQTREGGALQSLDRGQTRNLDLDLIGGRLFGAGPGWIESVRTGGMDLASESRGGRSASNAGWGMAPSRGLTYVRVDFQEAVRGQALSPDLRQWTIAFHESVETLLGPVRQWEERLHADSPSGLGPRGMLLTSRQLTVSQMGLTPQGDPLLELSALGRPHIESLNLTADGERLTYDAGKGLLVLEGGREEARFWHRTDAGVETDGAAQRIQYWPQDNRLDADLKFLDFDLQRIRSAAVNRLPRR